MRVLVTGAAGFIGSHMMCRLLEAGVDATGVDNYDPYYDVALKRSNVDGIRRLGGRVDEVDLLDRSGLSDLAQQTRPDVVLHLAAKAGVRRSLEHPPEFYEVNVMGTLNVFEAIRAVGSGRVVMGSTSSVYGSDTPMPFSEDAPAVHPPQPYAASKRAAELLAQTYHDTFGIETTITRFFTVYGPRGRPDMMPMLLLRSINEGIEIPLFGAELRRDWTYIDDICAGVEAAIRRPLGFEIINLGRGTPVSLGEFIGELERVQGRTAHVVPRDRPNGEMDSTYADISKAAELLGYAPTVSVAEGISRLSEWYDSTMVR